MAIVIHGTNGISSDDNVKAQFGDGNDLQIYHDGSHSYIDDAGTGRLYIRADAHITLTNATGTETYANFASNGAVGLRYDNSTKLVTTSTGVDITGQLNADAAVIDTSTGNIQLSTDAGGSISIGLKNDTSSTPYFDFNSGSTTTDYDVRIQAEGGNGTAGNGTFKIVADNALVEGEFRAYSYNETYVALSGTTPTVNCESGNIFALSTTGNTTFTFSNPPASGTAYGFMLRLTAGGTHTITYPASVDWAGATAPDAPASGETDVLVFTTTDGGTTWYGALAIDAAG
jgi:hypothetical protein